MTALTAAGILPTPRRGLFGRVWHLALVLYQWKDEAGPAVRMKLENASLKVEVIRWREAYELLATATEAEITRTARIDSLLASRERSATSSLPDPTIPPPTVPELPIPASMANPSPTN